ncbi:uncharacterized protein MAM_08300 [Metarhizium album ARSEF 1941]|uniref:Uncharacterized protein n=1 Tax=Metarhizium album (strain ARSEF 1941) TaxID=1081103 RepID=A0A0B2WDB7_METAS|nr:uncharacterized protein MAM_08300 [Metarhizium album ARSEF 1941]KHN93821.1 hypothetical protein MAM_08300 [Metarhizium album ARSEF 1941]
MAIQSRGEKTWFHELEGLAYSVVQYIPGIGTLYSLQRAAVTYSQRDWVRYWESVVKLIEGTTRDVVLVSGTVEPVVVTVIHSMSESLSEKTLEMWNKDPSDNKLKIEQELDKESGHIIISESSPGQLEERVFEGMAKGLHHFHGAVFEGVIKEPSFSWKGEKFRMFMPEGLFTGATVTFMWRWTKSAFGTLNSPAATWGAIQLDKPDYSHTRFRLSRRMGSGGWAGYDFWGEILSNDRIIAKTRVNGENVVIYLRRVAGT